MAVMRTPRVGQRGLTGLHCGRRAAGAHEGGAGRDMDMLCSLNESLACPWVSGGGFGLLVVSEITMMERCVLPPGLYEDGDRSMRSACLPSSTRRKTRPCR
ncbi:unnamed protein product [Rangifer tarandus platyrhynchus]|uniref:Uncharacterized protein n=1 Tax=Rangifer tarandus platyrhynchus TaxID=3082113 RepID=A0ABN8YTV8_RANTA|nr:unnamed protein product [Rangifer tarandus platyrhynchus]